MHLRRPFAAASVVAASIACFALAAAAAPLASYDRPPVAGPWGLAPGEYYVDITGTSFQTSSGYDAHGDRVGLGGTVQERAFRSYVELGWKKTMSVQLSMPFVTVTERPDGAPGASATGLEDFGFGLRWMFAQGHRATALQLNWEAPAGYNHRLTPALGDGLQKLSATLQVGGPAGKRAFWNLGGGMRLKYRAISDFKDELCRRPDCWKWPDHMVTNGAAGMWFGHLQAAGLFATDVGSFLPGERASAATSVAVGTRFTYRTDGRLDAFAGSWHTLSGKNSLALNEYYAGIAWKSTKLDRLRGFLGGDARP